MAAKLVPATMGRRALIFGANARKLLTL